MGQYYMPILREPQNNKHYKDTVFYAHRYQCNGLKLMEHSYVGNSFVNEVWRKLINAPQKVYWFGDYSKPGENDKGGLSARAIERFKRIFRNRDGEYQKYYFYPSEEEGFAPDDIQLRYPILLNHSEKEYIDIRLLRSDIADIFNYTVCPLPLLTATSNGKGAGDYYEQEGADDIGAWAGDLLEVVDADSIPANYIRRITTFESNL